LQDGFDLPKAQVNERCANEEDKDDYEFPHIGRIIHKHPQENLAGALTLQYLY